MDCNNPITTAYIGDLPLDTLSNLPDFMLAERDVEDPTTGNIARTLVRVPSQRLFPQGNWADIAAIQPNNSSIEVPEGQVRAGYVTNEGSTVVTRYADGNHQAIFLMIGFAADMLLVQGSGFVNIPGGHDYVPGVPYYTSTDGSGEPVTDDASGQLLFIPISHTQLEVFIRG